MAQDLRRRYSRLGRLEILLRSRSVGISARRVEWFIRWAEKVAGSPAVQMASFEEGLGRIMFVAGALEHEKPFPAPLKKFLPCIRETQ